MTTLTLYPAIDLLAGRCVRLRQGDYRQVTVFGDDPVAAALNWQRQGAEWLHIIDLDGARAGRPAHLEMVTRIIQATGLPVQLGGGLRDEAAVASAFDAGAARVILGTAAARDPDLVTRSLARWDERIAIAVDIRDGRLAVAGWRDMLPESPFAFAERMIRLGVTTLVVTNVERDGTLMGSDTSSLERLRAALPETHLIAAGGLASLNDIQRLARARIDGAVLGRALYEGAFDLSKALLAARTTVGQGITAC
ncbi:MAG TPA: 1-(5-phosphoribosyl)-5-[(5-phosphoribosylamino)methylideneamino]imidazole-4-carboxamide isomerase [Thermomicrobiaceae bacterium]|nr:1-(5-phosphoribosyl)-5-[(5-phosphoribosylamino)methylideneamino]imidazole-4-carboxamide isomerase [Thermomicrobiaceae bacterium]